MIKLQADGDGAALNWADGHGYKWTINLDGPDEAAGTLLSLRFAVQLHCTGRMFEIGPATCTPTVQLQLLHDRAFARFDVVVPITDQQIHTIEEARQGGPLSVRLQPWAEMAVPSLPAALSAVDTGRDQDAGWWRSALAAWSWGSSILMVVKRPTSTASPLTTAYERIVRAQSKLLADDCRAAVMELRGAFETLRSLPRPGAATGNERSVEERWWDLIPKAAFDLSSASVHDDGQVRDHKWTRREAEGLLALAAALFGVALDDR